MLPDGGSARWTAGCLKTCAMHDALLVVHAAGGVLVSAACRVLERLKLLQHTVNSEPLAPAQAQHQLPNNAAVVRTFHCHMQVDPAMELAQASHAPMQTSVLESVMLLSTFDLQV